MPWQGCERKPKPESSYRTVLALDAGAIEAQGGDSVDGPLDAEDALIASLARLRLGQVSSLKGDWLYLPNRYQDLLRGHQLWTVLGEQAERLHLSWLISSKSLEPAQTLWYPGSLPRRRMHLI